MSHARLTYPCQRWLQPRKGEGTIACQEKALTGEATVATGSQRKAYKVKAGLPEPQSERFITGHGRRVADAPVRGGSWSCASAMPAQPTRRALNERDNGRRRGLSTPDLDSSVIAGSPKQVEHERPPAWRRRLHSTQMPIVTDGTDSRQQAVRAWERSGWQLPTKLQKLGGREPVLAATNQSRSRRCADAA